MTILILELKNDIICPVLRKKIMISKTLDNKDIDYMLEIASSSLLNSKEKAETLYAYCNFVTIINSLEETDSTRKADLKKLLDIYKNYDSKGYLPLSKNVINVKWKKLS